jgi:hypothetical protein
MMTSSSSPSLSASQESPIDTKNSSSSPSGAAASQQRNHDENQQIVTNSCIQKLNNLLNVSKKAKIKYVQDYCQLALQQMGSDQPRPEEVIHTSLEMSKSGLLPIDINFNLRFSRTWDPNEKLKKSSSIFGIGTIVLGPNDYENVTSEKILNAPIKDICLVQRNDAVPENYYRISRTPLNKKADLNTGSGGNHLYLCIKKDVQCDLPPITALVVLYPDRKESVPPGFTVVKRNGKPCNLNAGTKMNIFSFIRIV